MNNNKGGVIIEFLIALPLFLLIILVIISASAINNAHTSLDFAVANAVRLAVSRGDDEIAAKIDVNYRIAKRVSGAQASSNFNEIFVYNPNNTLVVPNDYKSLILGSGDPQNVSTLALPTAHRLALALVYQYMKEAVGSMVQFPCDPDDLNNENRFGCMNCYFREELDNGCYLPVSGFSGKPQGCAEDQVSDDVELPEMYINLTCRYLPNEPALKMLTSIVGAEMFNKVYQASTRQEMLAKNWVYD